MTFECKNCMKEVQVNLREMFQNLVENLNKFQLQQLTFDMMKYFSDQYCNDCQY